MPKRDETLWMLLQFKLILVTWRQKFFLFKLAFSKVVQEDDAGCNRR
jgi:hypothetical protein